MWNLGPSVLCGSFTKVDILTEKNMRWISVLLAFNLFIDILLYLNYKQYQRLGLLFTQRKQAAVWNSHDREPRAI